MQPAAPRLILASASPARLATLRRAGLDPEVVVSDVDESGTRGPNTAVTTRMLAGLKADAVAQNMRDVPAGTLILGCDSLLDLDGEALGKPGTSEAAVARWRAMRGRQGVLYTGHALVEPATGRRDQRVAATTVTFAELSDAEIEAYVATGEPLHVAGAFTIDGYGGAYVQRIGGDHHNVVGVSLPLLRTMVEQFGVAWHQLWKAH
ncbi:MAG: Maf family protein [Sporichthyaceae bacterium]